MIKRNDLAKQFELVVKQEIKNYQNSLDFVLQSIKEIKESIVKVRDESLANYSMLHSVQENLSKEINSLKDSLFSLVFAFERSKTDQKGINELSQIQITNLKEGIVQSAKINNEFHEKVDSICKEVNHISETSKINLRTVNDNIDDLLRRFTNVIEKTKKDILDAPTEAKLVRAQLEEKFSCHKVDVQGIMQELKIYKHENMVTQKKIENIYTLIERLKKSEVIL